ncbi:MAG: SDR family NAD(P)-dependent oxidoreductase, partial [Gammaproteobacteria bacterium]
LVADHVAERLGALDGLVLAAAMLGDLTPLSHYDTVTWARVFQVNLHANLLLAQALRPLLRRSGHGRVVFTLADEAYTAKPNWGAYAVSKFALRGLFELWANECAADPTLRVNAIVPPPLRTRLRMDAFPAIDAATLPAPSIAVAACLALLGDAAPRGTVVRIEPPPAD